MSSESVFEPATSKFLSRASPCCVVPPNKLLVQKAHDAISYCVVPPNKLLVQKALMQFHAVSYHSANRACPKNPRCSVTLCRTHHPTNKTCCSKKPAAVSRTMKIPKKCCMVVKSGLKGGKYSLLIGNQSQQLPQDTKHRV